LELREAFGFYVLPDQKRLKLMRNVRLADVKEHYKSTHTTSNMRFVVAGNLPSARRRIIKQLLENMALPKGRGRKALPTERPKKLEAPLHIRNKTVKNYYFYLDTFVGRQLEDAEMDSLGLLNSMLTETLYSRILGTAREKGLVYGMSSGINRSKYHTNWWFGAQVRPDNASALLEIMILELQKVFKGKLTRQDIEDAKQYALGRYQRSAQTVGGISNGYGHRYFFDDVIEDYYKVPDQIKAINKPCIIDSAQAMFTENVWGFGVLGGATNEPVKELYQQIDVLWNSRN
jgi:predicted Zn-dependent peptidase